MKRAAVFKNPHLVLYFMSLVSVGIFATLITIESEVGKSGQKHLFKKFFLFIS